VIKVSWKIAKKTSLNFDGSHLIVESHIKTISDQQHKISDQYDFRPGNLRFPTNKLRFSTSKLGFPGFPTNKLGLRSTMLAQKAKIWSQVVSPG
jgi:hypothetical protein